MKIFTCSLLLSVYSFFLSLLTCFLPSYFQISPSALSKLRYLESLDLSHNSLESLSPSCFSGLPLVEVDLSHNSFREFDLEVFASKVHSEPVSVDLSQNKLVSVSAALYGRVLHIQSLTLSSNQLSSVPSLAGLLLRYLNLDGNPIRQITEGAFAQLKDLVYLSLSGLPELEHIRPMGFKGLQSLQVLDLSNNPKLKSLSPTVFSGLDSLQELNLTGSGVASLPANMLTHLPSIKSITLGRNNHCWRTQKQGLFHRQMGQVQHNEVLTCNTDGIVLWGNGLLLGALIPELCLHLLRDENTFICVCVCVLLLLSHRDILERLLKIWGSLHEVSYMLYLFKTQSLFM